MPWAMYGAAWTAVRHSEVSAQDVALGAICCTILAASSCAVARDAAAAARRIEVRILMVIVVVLSRLQLREWCRNVREAIV